MSNVFMKKSSKINEGPSHLTKQLLCTHSILKWLSHSLHFCLLGTNYFQKVLGHLGLKNLKIGYIVPLITKCKKIRDSIPNLFLDWLRASFCVLYLNPVNKYKYCFDWKFLPRFHYLFSSFQKKKDKFKK